MTDRTEGTRTRIRTLSRALLGAGALALGGCHDAGVGPEPSYEGCATDENWRTMDDYIKSSRVKTDAGSVPKWLEPADGASAPAATPVVLRFQPSAGNGGSDNGDATCPQFQPSGLHGLHLSPVSGTVFDLHFRVDGADVYRILTTRQKTAVALETWKGWAGKRVSVDLYSAKMLSNDVVEGPFKSSLTISVTQ